MTVKQLACALRLEIDAQLGAARMGVESGCNNSAMLHPPQHPDERCRGCSLLRRLTKPAKPSIIALGVETVLYAARRIAWPTGAGAVVVGPRAERVRLADPPVDALRAILAASTCDFGGIHWFAGWSIGRRLSRAHLHPPENTQEAFRRAPLRVFAQHRTRRSAA
jgi:hypothetical protein